MKYVLTSISSAIAMLLLTEFFHSHFKIPTESFFIFVAVEYAIRLVTEAYIV